MNFLYCYFRSLHYFERNRIRIWFLTNDKFVSGYIVDNISEFERIVADLATDLA